LVTEPAAAAATVRDDIAGAKVTIRADGTATLQ
jgi:acetyl-CoA C-acetyltransferase